MPKKDEENQVSTILMRSPDPPKNKFRSASEDMCGLNPQSYWGKKLTANIETWVNYVNETCKVGEMWSSSRLKATNWDECWALKSAIVQGGLMQKVLDEVAELQREVSVQSKETFQNLFNNVAEVYNQVAPLLRKQMDELRNARLQAVTEINSSLKLMRDIRAFFLEPEHIEQIARLKDFIKTCNELKRLKDEGILDAIGETILKLVVNCDDSKR